MTTNQLKYFITAAECLNFTEAAKQHYISQTAITQHMQALEEDLEVKLFDRQKRKVSPDTGRSGFFNRSTNDSGTQSGCHYTHPQSS